CTVECVNLSRTMPAPMQERLLEALDEAAEEHAAGLHMRMPSGAGHDAQSVAQRLPAAMMFVPSIGGISHHFTENTADGDIVLGCQVFADAAAKILARN
ncbi:MAG: M20/M25/M40 family metallo-hydrolase, partial [Alphaproteobacteria bacterium]|nr:M20/M25/M40 family metallo-hydrolase [Alphaproteobacteria bacterium]